MPPHPRSPLPYRIYQALPAPVHRLGEAALRLRAERSFRREPRFDSSPRRLLIGPLNTAGQAAGWSRAVREHVSDATALSLWAQRGNATPALGYRTDITLAKAVQLRGQRPYRALAQQATHLLAESAFRVFDDVRTGDISDDVAAIADAGTRLGLVFHGSDLRDLRRHAEMYDTSPFRSEWDEVFTRMQDGVQRRREVADRIGAPIFVSTPDMLDSVPDATWLPLAVDTGRYLNDRPVLDRDRPVVLHAPTNSRLKGTAEVEQALARLEGEGLIDYRRLTGVPNEQMPAALAEADIVIDQVVLGNVGVLATEAMAAGRVVISHLLPHVRARFEAADPQPDQGSIPILNATPHTLAEVITGVLADRGTFADLAARGPGWAARNHDGRRSAQVLADFLRS